MTPEQERVIRKVRLLVVMGAFIIFAGFSLVLFTIVKRVSNTEPVIRIACEARTADEADDLLRRVTRHVQAAIHE